MNGWCSFGRIVLGCVQKRRSAGIHVGFAKGREKGARRIFGFLLNGRLKANEIGLGHLLLLSHFLSHFLCIEGN